MQRSIYSIARRDISRLSARTQPIAIPLHVPHPLYGNANRLVSRAGIESNYYDKISTINRNYFDSFFNVSDIHKGFVSLLSRGIGRKSSAGTASGSSAQGSNEPKHDEEPASSAGTTGKKEDGIPKHDEGSASQKEKEGMKTASNKKESTKKTAEKGGSQGKQEGAAYEFELKPGDIFRNGIIALIAYMIYRSMTGESTSNTREVDWQNFKAYLLNSGNVERLVVVNKQICKVYLRQSLEARDAAAALIAHERQLHRSDSIGGTDTRKREETSGGSDIAAHEANPNASDKLSTHASKGAEAIRSRELSPEAQFQNIQRQGGAPFYFTIGSVESFERKLEIAQRELGIASKDFIPVQYVSETNWGSELLKFAPTLLIIGTTFYLLRGMASGGSAGGGGGMSRIFQIGKSPAKVFGKDSKVNVTFKDVAGCDEAKAEIVEFVDFLKNPARFTKLGAKIPKGALLCGPPGTGKTLLAKAVAGEAGVPFYSISGSDFIEMFVGVGPSRVRDLFKEAREHSPCIVFIDEIDAVARARGKGGFSGGSDERENTLNQLLVEMDGFTTKDGVVVLAGTNRIDILDPAILRPGRFDRQIKVDLPDIQGRKAIFLVHLKKIPIAGVSAEQVANRMAALTPGFSGAQIANICNEAAIFAARAGKDGVDLPSFERAVERVMGGLERKNSLMTLEEKKTIAYHEAGHAIAGWFLENADPLLKVSIVPRTNGALGFAQYLPKEMSIHTTEQILDRMAMALGGRAAEELFFKKISTGAHDDLSKVTALAMSMVTKFGMNKRIGQVVFNQDDNQLVATKPYSEATAKIIDEEVRTIVDSAYTRVMDLLKTHSTAVEKVAELLIQKETISQHDIVSIVGERPFTTNQNYAEFLKLAENSTKSTGEESKSGSTSVGNEKETSKGNASSDGNSNKDSENRSVQTQSP